MHAEPVRRGQFFVGDDVGTVGVTVDGVNVAKVGDSVNDVGKALGASLSGVVGIAVVGLPVGCELVGGLV